jgi:hypothetical protein
MGTQMELATGFLSSFFFTTIIVYILLAGNMGRIKGKGGPSFLGFLKAN